MARSSLVALLLASGAAGSKLLVTSYAGTITTLDTESTSPSGGNHPAMKAVATFQGCKQSPSWLTLDHCNHVLYCIDEGLSTPGGHLYSLRVNADSTVTQLGEAESLGGPVHGSFYSGKRGFAMAHYGGSALSNWDISDPANIKLVHNITFDDPHGPKPEQNAPHPHEAVLDPTGKFIIVPDLGTDLVYVFSFDAKTLIPTRQSAIKLKPGTGPRHVAFAVKGSNTFMYLITELSNNIIGYQVTYPKNIEFKQIFEIGSHGEGKPVPANAAAAEVVVSPDNKFLIASTRRENSTTIPSFDDKSKQIESDSIINFSIDDATGNLKLVQDIPAGGQFPRQFSINADGTKVAVGLQLDGRVVVIQRDPKTGMLGDFESFANIEGPITNVLFNE